jgi:hypothetical protein
VEVQDEGSQVLAYLLAPRRGEMVADYCAGAGGKTLAIAMLMRGTGRVYAMDVSARRLAELAPRAARAGVTSVHPLVLHHAHHHRRRHHLPAPAQAHRALDLHPAVAHFFRFWLWLTTGMVTKEWVAIHRKHHAKCETDEDPHSPQVLGIKKVLLRAPSCTRRARNGERWPATATARPTTGSSATSTRRTRPSASSLMLVLNVLLFGPSA